MRIQRWTRKFKDDMESTLAPVWVTLPEPLWHYHNWEAMEQILEPIGTLISLDKATMARTRPTTAKAQVEIDLSKPRLNEVEVALIDGNGDIDMFIQQIEYESFPDFFFHCRVQGHSDTQYRMQQPKGNASNSPGSLKIKQNEKVPSEDEKGWIEVKNSKNNRKKLTSVRRRRLSNR